MSITNCRYCNHELTPVLDLGYLYPSVYIKTIEEQETYKKEPLVLAKCEYCGLVQLHHNYNLDNLYRDYYYKSGANSDMVKALTYIANKVNKLINFSDNDVILDIGCNDGTLLKIIQELNNKTKLFKIGIDPELTFREEALEQCDVLVSEFFDINKYPIKQKAKLITAIAMFYDLPNPKRVAGEIKRILDDKGLFIVQFMDLYHMLKMNEFSNICQEHLEYYSIEWLVDFFEKEGLEVFKIEENDTNGGSTCFFISHPDVYEIEQSVDEFISKERTFMSSFKDPFRDFELSIYKNKNILLDFLDEQYMNNKAVMSLGAATKFSFFSQYYKLNRYRIRCIGEINKSKIGKCTIGSNIPIVDEKDVINENPPYIMVNIWQFKPFFKNMLSSYVEGGGNVIFPLPIPTLWNKHGEITIENYFNIQRTEYGN